MVLHWSGPGAQVGYILGDEKNWTVNKDLQNQIKHLTSFWIMPQLWSWQSLKDPWGLLKKNFLKFLEKNSLFFPYSKKLVPQYSKNQGSHHVCKLFNFEA